ncbi:40S ribosomal protein S5-like [Pistacia vera]|uniref:40S ribosomal protein S5-like n=1 Tax=Pistacia vera TaxID=55513 RepID=UPI0012639DF7|nr:40S ribosomal protein S5-like [Pistacia vera]
MLHINEVLTLMMVRQSTNGDNFYQHCVITDVSFGQSLVSIYETLEKKANDGGARRGGKRRRMVVEEFDGVLVDYWFDEGMMQYMRGEMPKYGNSWAKVKKAWNIESLAQFSLNEPVDQLYCVVIANEILFAGAQNIKTIAKCLADELINAAKGSSNSYAIKQKDVIVRVAKANR